MAKILIPTATNILLLVHDNINQNFRKFKSSNIELPSIYRRAKMIVNLPGEIVIAEGEIDA